MGQCPPLDAQARRLRAQRQTNRTPVRQTASADEIETPRRMPRAICQTIRQVTAPPIMRLVPCRSRTSSSNRCSRYAACAKPCQGAHCASRQIRGLLDEFDLLNTQGIGHIAKRVPQLVDDASNERTGSFRLLVQRRVNHRHELDRQVDEFEAQIKTLYRASEALCELPFSSCQLQARNGGPGAGHQAAVRGGRAPDRAAAKMRPPAAHLGYRAVAPELNTRCVKTASLPHRSPGQRPGRGLKRRCAHC